MTDQEILIDTNDSFIKEENLLNNFSDKKLNKYKIQSELNFIENVNSEYLEIILNNFDDVYSIIGKVKDHKKGYSEIKDKKAVFTMLEKRLKHGDNFTYKTSGGRMVPNGYSCCFMNKILRHTIAGESNIDIDVDNCHPVILSWYSKVKGWDCDNLDYYINNREEFLKTVGDFYEISRDESKTKILSLINNENDGFNNDSPLYELYQEILILQKNVCNFRKDIYQKAKKKDLHNTQGVCMSLFLQEIENKICQCMIEYCNDNNVHVTAPCYDGILVSKDNFTEDLLNKIELYIYDTLDIKVSLSTKEMNKHIRNQLSKYKDVKKEPEYDHFDLIELSDQRLGIYILNKLKEEKFIFYHKHEDLLYCYNETKKLYEIRDKDFIMTYISDNLKILFKNIQESNNKLNPMTVAEIKKRMFFTESTSTQKQILTQIKIRLDDDSVFINKYFDKIPYLFPISKNRIIDFRFDTIRERTREDYFTHTTNLDYDKNVDIQEIRNFMRIYLIPRDKVLDEDDEIHIDSFLMSMGYCLTGYNNLKKYFIMIGPKDTGKSTILNDKMFDLFGDFYTTVDKKVICETKSNSVHTQELFQLLRKRFISTGEITDSDVVNKTLIKTITGNDKKISMRRCGGNIQFEAQVDCKICLPCNSPMKSDDPAVLDRMIAFNFPNVFKPNTLTNEEYYYIKEGINDNFVSTIFKYAHFFVKNNQTIKWSKQISLSTSKIVEECDELHEFFNNNYEITNNPKDRVPKINIFDRFKDLYGLHELSRHKTRFYKKFEKFLSPLDVYRNSEYKYIKTKIKQPEPEIVNTSDILSCDGEFDFSD
jgi:phage/plasmid-associated DNA primase